MDDPVKAQQLLEALLMADGEVRVRVMQHPQLGGGPEQILRRDAYLEVIQRWMKSLP